MKLFINPAVARGAEGACSKIDLELQVIDPDGGYDEPAEPGTQEYHDQALNDFHDYVNSVNRRNDEGELEGTGYDLGGGMDADGTRRDMDGMILMAGMTRSLGDDQQVDYNGAKRQWGYWEQIAQRGAPNPWRSHGYDPDKEYGFEVDYIGGWNGAAAPSMSASSGIGAGVFSSTLRSGGDGPSAVPSPWEFVENTATIISIVMPVGLLYRGAKVVGRVFWSGKAAKQSATLFAKSRGLTTLGMTRAGRNLEKLTKTMEWKEAGPLWERLSRVYAKGANGPVYFIGVPRPESIWMKIEKPILDARGIEIINPF